MDVKCPNCKHGKIEKAISMFIPLKICLSCGSVYGGFLVDVYLTLVAPVEAFFTGGFTFMVYEGSYLRGLWHYIVGYDDEV